MDALRGAWEFIQAGGPVMWPLLAVSLWLWTLIIIKATSLYRTAHEHMDLPTARHCLESGSAPPGGPGPRAGALRFFLERRGGGRSQMVQWEVAVRHQAPALASHVDTVLMLAAVAPLLGLLGTVSGMIDTFEVICRYGTGNAQAMASGISEALITTQTGLLVAIPGVLAGMALRRQARKQQNRLLAFYKAISRWLEAQEAEAC